MITKIPIKCGRSPCPYSIRSPTEWNSKTLCWYIVLGLRQRPDRHHFICIVTHKVTYSIL